MQRILALVAVGACASPPDVSVDPPNYSFFDYDHLHGTLCGRRFP